jgi:2-polyprenyl-3-methyl-5-hydroxy-6-metoxy-1,4-benzoquinol methylase
MTNTPNQGLWEEVACNLCGSKDYRVKIKPWVTDFDPQKILSASGGIRGTQQIVLCRQCGLEYVNPRLRSEQVVSAYGQAVDELYAEAGPGRLATFRKGLKLVESYCPERGRLLDVGCACGFFVKAAQDAGWQAEGVELSQWSADYGRDKLGVKIFPGLLSEAKFPDNSFDAITVWDVLEHVPDPISELNEIYRILKPGGLLLINYPNTGSLLTRLAGRNWWFYLSVHLYYFTPRTISRLLEKAGFKVIAHRRHTQVLPLGHLIKIAAIYLKGAARLGYKLAAALHLTEMPLPYYAAQANVIARKPAGGGL